MDVYLSLIICLNIYLSQTGGRCVNIYKFQVIGDKYYITSLCQTFFGVSVNIAVAFNVCRIQHFGLICRIKAVCYSFHTVNIFVPPGSIKSIDDCIYFRVGIFL